MMRCTRIRGSGRWDWLVGSDDPSADVPSRTALDDSMPAMELENACNESCQQIYTVRFLTTNILIE